MFNLRYPPELPVSARRDDLLAALRGHQVVIVAGETGSGKTTQLPKLCLEAGLAARGRIGCTQPRRVAAMSVSRRVAEELGVTWGREVGCKVRFNDDTSRETLIKFMTDGMLLAEIQSDPHLRAYTAMIIDEAHERSLNIDFLLGYLPGLLRRRGDLKLIVTSATIDTAAFSAAFGGAPVIEVSGRLWPVEIRYAPLADWVRPGETEDEVGPVEAAVRAAEDALLETDAGDVLVFLPTEREIREAREILEGSLGRGFEVLGLFGRMPAAEQQRIFAPEPRRRVIVATNIAETSLTLPRIRYVIDAGLSRMSRYNPRTRTKRLPVEEISQSSANQRAGRAGRVQDGICIRLYAEEDFARRPRFTQPEIQRANLAEVILRMKAFHLGDIENFPFLNPPSPTAIRAGYALLHELGAVDEVNALTALGGELARLPVDPTLGRMLLQARMEGAMEDVLIIAAGLSVPDPRERPEDQREAAAAAQRQFLDPDSDFLSLLNIWRAAPEAEGKGSGNALRRFCKTHFLSVARMREWRDIYRQLVEATEEKGGRRHIRLRGAEAAPAGDDGYGPIHRAILAGLLGHIGQRQERNLYKVTGNRQAFLFPGSNLHRREQRAAAGEGKKGKVAQPDWIVAGELVETSQLFARSVAGIDPAWVLDLGSHLCQRRYTEPHWSAKAARVLALERVLLGGLEVARRQVDYGRIDPAAATELFIRGALVAGEARLPLRFFTENQKVREKLETALTRVRSRRAHDLDEALYLFYAARLRDVSSVHDLNRLVRARVAAEPDFLCATEEDLIGGDDATFEPTMFPDRALLANAALPLTYAYRPGEEADGVTVRVPLPIAEHLTSGQLQWMVPGLREEQIAVLLRALPKSVRKTLHPLEPKVREIAGELDPGRGDFLDALAAFLRGKYGAAVQSTDWPPQSLPAHLRPRVEVIDEKGKQVAAGRDLEELQAAARLKAPESGAWAVAARHWERDDLKQWSIGDLPESVLVEKIGGAEVRAVPGLVAQDGGAGVRLFRSRDEAAEASIGGVRRLAETVLARDLARVWKELASLGRPSTTPAKSTGGAWQAALQRVGASAPDAAFPAEVLQKSGYEHLLTRTLTLRPIFPLTAARFVSMVEGARRELPALTWRLGDDTQKILALRSALLASPRRYAGLEEDLARLVPPDFLAQTPPEQLPHLSRYLRAMQVRADRAAVNPAKDVEKARQLAEFRDWRKRVPLRAQEEFRWQLEEYRVSLFAQELGTAQPVSAQRLRAAFA